MHEQQLPAVARAIAGAACGDGFAVSATLTTSDRDMLTEVLPQLTEAVSAAVGSSPPLDNGGWIAETAMLTLSATFDTRAAACDAHPRWIAALDAMRDRLRDEFAVTELFVSKHRTAAPAPTLVGMD